MLTREDATNEIGRLRDIVADLEDAATSESDAGAIAAGELASMRDAYSSLRGTASEKENVIFSLQGQVTVQQRQLSATASERDAMAARAQRAERAVEDAKSRETAALSMCVLGGGQSGRRVET